MNKKKLKRYLLMLIPQIPIPFLLIVPGYSFSIFLCLALGLLTGIYVTLSLFSGKTSRILRRVLTVLVGLIILLATGTEVYLLTESRLDSKSCRYVIVLGAGVNGTKPSRTLQNRIDRAFAYLTANPDVICVVSGGQGEREDISEAECMYLELTKMGIAPERIWQENQSVSTVENLEFSIALIEEKTGVCPETLGIITNEFHMTRAKLMARHQGIDPVGIPAKTGRMSLKINYYLREIAALWKYVVKGWL